ncbi:MAG: hypothetical protein U0L84_01910 [Acutalibacteraceae bacterium]|nr:hypothetical protein [Acutalibacteraceae bacterium]
MKNYFKIIIALALALCVVVSTGAMFGVFADPLEGITVASGSQNLLSNGGFEYSDSVAAIDTATENTYLTSGWVVGNVSNTSFAISDDAKSGKKSLSATLSSGAQFALRSDNANADGIISGLESGVYALSLYARGSGNIAIKYKDAAVKNIAEKSLALTSEWQMLCVDAVVVGASGKIQFEIRSAGDSGTIFVDDVSFTKYTGLQNGDFENATGYTVPKALYDFGCNTNYNYISTGNPLYNAGFEDATAITNSSSKAWENAIIVDGWTTSWSHSNFVYSITDDTHSGKYALRLDIAQNAGDTRLHANKDLITDTELKGRITGLTANETYIVNYWVKGNAKSRIYAKNLTDTGADAGNVRYDYIPANDDWNFVSQEVTANALGQVWWNINVTGLDTGASYVILDDVSMLTKAQAIANTEAMIEAFSTQSAYAVQAKADIEKWVAVLGQSNISNYNIFTNKINGTSDSGSQGEVTPQEPISNKKYTYLSNGNILDNSGFELSNDATNTSGKEWNKAPITDGWVTSYSASAKFSYSISGDAHSGNNSLKVTMPTNSANNDDTRIFANKNLIVDTELKGRISGLTADETYIVSYWVKGSGKSQIFWKKLTSSGTFEGTNVRDGLKQYDDWTLVTDEVTAFAVGSDGQAWWNINAQRTKDNETVLYIDDVLMQTKSQAIKNVEAMIDNLNVTSSYADRAVADIEQWIAALGSANISNYDIFVAKKSIGSNNLLENPGFEASSEVNYTVGSFKNFTSGWMTSDEIKSGNTTVEISNDAHSGNNSLKITGKANKEYRIFNNTANKDNTTEKGITENLAADTKYLVSYWVKGNAASRVYAKSYSSGSWSTNWGTKLENPGDDWKLYTKEVNTNSAGETWFNVYVYADAGKYVFIDDISMQTKAHAIADVEAMITVFNPTDTDAVKKAKDIEQWINALGKANITNYNAFVAKSSQIANYDFELDNNATLVNGDYTNITTGWKTNYVSNATPYSVSILNDAYSGNNAFKVNVNKVDSGSGFRLLPATANGDKTDSITDGVISGYTPNTDYIISYWVKGTADTKVFGKTNNGSTWNTNWQSVQKSNADKWTLSAHTIKSDASGNIWWAIFVVGDVADTYAIIDNVELLPISEAKANVEAMISAFDYTKATDEDVYVITEWMKAVSVSQTAKDSFKSKLADYEALQAELSWESIDNVFGWETNDKSSMTVSNSQVAFGNSSLKINAQSSVGLRPTQMPYGMQDGYYMLVLYAKGGGKLKVTASADNGIDTYEILSEELNIANNWDKYIISNINIKENYSISDLRFEFSDSNEIFIDAIQMYRQIGPGSKLDVITQNVTDGKLLLGGTPDGYYTELYKTSDSDILSPLGEITAPKYNSNVEYRFKIVNINDSADYAISDARLLSVEGIDGAAPTEQGKAFTQRTLTDQKTGVSVTAKMSDEARLTVNTLDETSKYYDLLLNYGNECIAQFNIFTIPQTAYEGDRTITFTVDSKYNGETLIITRYDKSSRTLEEYEAKVKDGRLTITVPNDGAFMIQKTPVKPVVAPQTSENNKEETKHDLPSKDKNEKEDGKDKTDNGFKNPNRQVIVKQGNNSKLIWTIIIIGLGLLLLMLMFTVVVIFIRRRREEEGTADIDIEENMQ